MTDEQINILIDGWYGMSNIGDEAILNALVNIITREYNKSYIEVFSYHPANTLHKHDIDNAIHRLEPPIINLRQIQAIRRADQLWIGGGGYYSTELDPTWSSSSVISGT